LIFTNQALKCRIQIKTKRCPTVPNPILTILERRTISIETEVSIGERNRRFEELIEALKLSLKRERARKTKGEDRRKTKFNAIPLSLAPKPKVLEVPSNKTLNDLFNLLTHI